MKYIVSIVLSISVIICWSAEDHAKKSGILHYPQLITFVHEKGTACESFDLEQEDNLQYESFVDLINQQKNKDRAFIIARLLTTTGSKKTVSYVEANALHRLWWFKGHLYPEDINGDDIEDTSVHNRFPSFEIDPSSKMMVRGEVPYFIAKHGGNDDADDNNIINFYYIGSSRDLISKDIRGRYLCTLLMAHYGASHENVARQSASHFLARVYQGEVSVPGIKANEQLSQYYKAKAITDTAVKSDTSSNCVIS